MTNPINKDELRRLAEKMLANPVKSRISGPNATEQHFIALAARQDFRDAVTPEGVLALLNASDAKEEECRRLREALEEIKILALSIISGANRIS